MTFLDRLLGRGGGDLLEQQEETRRIIRLLQEELTPEEVVHDFVRQGVSVRQARRRVQLVLKVQRQGCTCSTRPRLPGRASSPWEAISQRFENPCPTVDISE